MLFFLFSPFTTKWTGMHGKEERKRNIYGYGEQSKKEKTHLCICFSLWDSNQPAAGLNWAEVSYIYLGNSKGSSDWRQVGGIKSVCSKGREFAGSHPIGLVSWVRQETPEASKQESVRFRIVLVKLSSVSWRGNAECHKCWLSTNPRSF